MTVPDWSAVASAAKHSVSDAAIDTTWRALNYLCAAQLYLRDNPLLHEDLSPAHVTREPRGHWGVCPPVNWLLAHLGPLVGHRPAGSELVVVHGAGHASASALAHAYLTGALDGDGTAPEHPWSVATLTDLMRGPSRRDRYGDEITPLIPGVRHTGGQLGPALAIAQGMALDAPHRLAVALIGDGECETGSTAAAWLAPRAIRGGQHGTVLPVVLLNGMKMGGPSLLSTFTADEVRAYFAGLGYLAFVDEGRKPGQFRRLLDDALAVTPPLASTGPHPVVVLTMPKGQTCPQHVLGRQIIGTPAVHKTPLRRPATDPAEFTALADWLRSYRPHELFDHSGVPSAAVRSVLPRTPVPSGHGPPPLTSPSLVTGRGPTPVVESPDADMALIARAATGSFRVFSPDELSSNRILSSLSAGAAPWVTEILNEEICHAWLQGYTETGRHALLPTYDGFATVNASLLVQHLKHRRLRAHRGDTGLPSINYLLTSLGWDNTYTHQNPGLVSVLLDLEHAGTRIYTPADASRAALVLRRMLTDTDHCNVLITSKHPLPVQARGPVDDELQHGAAIWPHLTTAFTPDIVLASAGDIPARELSRAAADLLPGMRVRYVHVSDLTVLGSPMTWPHALTADRFTHLFGRRTPVLLATIGYPAAVRGLLAGRGDADRFHVVGYRDLGRPTTPQDLLDASGLSTRVLRARAVDIAGDASRRPPQ